MKIAFLTTEYPTEKIFAGGLASYLRRTAKAIHDVGHLAEIFTLSDKDETIEDGPVVIHRVRGDSSLLTTISSTPLAWRLTNHAQILIPILNLTRALLKRHEQVQFDIVQAASYRACGLFATFFPLSVVTRVSSFEPLWRLYYQKPVTNHQILIEKLELMQMRLSDAVYSPSQLLAGRLREEGLKVDVIEPPIDISLLQHSAITNDNTCITESEYALFFGSIGLLKGCDRIVRVLPALLKRNPDFNFYFVGNIFGTEDGEPFDVFIRKRLGAFGDRVKVFPPLPHQGLLALVRKARFVVLPSRIDNLPNTCLEAMLMERVVIAARDASFEQLIQNKITGFLVSQQDDQELMQTMDMAWKMNVEERLRIGKAALRSLNRLHPHQTIGNLLHYYQRVLLSPHKEKLRTCFRHRRDEGIVSTVCTRR